MTTASKSIEIAMTADDNYSNLLTIALTSIVLNSSSDINCHILTTGLSEDNLKKISAINKLNSNNFTFKIIEICPDDFAEFPKDRKLGLMANARLKIHKFIPDLDKILYLDCDIVAVDDIKKCYDYNFDVNELFGACMDYVSPQKAERINVNYHDYFNAGVLLMNLAKMREINFSIYCKKCLNNEKLTIKHDQDLLNAVVKHCNLTWLRMDARWNAFGDISFKKIKKTKLYNNELYLIREALENPSIIHYTGIKPTTYNYRARFGDIFWNYAEQSPIKGLEMTDKTFKNFLLKHFSTPKLQRKIRSLTKRL
jgi:lipopolysaccharide biosynthesis glycosyltransferase